MIITFTTDFDTQVTAWSDGVEITAHQAEAAAYLGSHYLFTYAVDTLEDSPWSIGNFASGRHLGAATFRTQAGVRKAIAHIDELISAASIPDFFGNPSLSADAAFDIASDVIGSINAHRAEKATFIPLGI